MLCQALRSLPAVDGTSKGFYLQQKLAGGRE
jgi:hypothetical protein